MKSVCVVTSTRADYGILRPLLTKINEDPLLELRLAVTGAHLSPIYGMTVDAIESDGFPIDCRIPILSGEDGAVNVSAAMANTLNGFSTYLSQRRPDIMVVLGDRYEIAAVCCAAVNEGIAIAHIHGGETTEGAVDECYRHSITKMSYLHFAACEAYRKRIIQLGEAPERVYTVGAMGVENALKMEKLSRDELSAQLGFELSRPYAVVTFHPVTLERGSELIQCEALFAALDAFPELGLIITGSNADVGGIRVNQAIAAYAATRSNCLSVSSLGAVRYMSVLKYARLAIGNSSSGIIEVPSFGIPTVNIGSRQRGRLCADSVITCAADKNEITAAISTALSPDFRRKAEKTVNPYGSGDTSDKILDVLKTCLSGPEIDLKKSFYDIPFEVRQ